MNDHRADIQDLLADRATGDLSDADRKTLDVMLAGEDDESMELAAAAAAIAMIGDGVEEMPAALRDRIMADATDYKADAKSLPEVKLTIADAKKGLPAWGGWMAAAATLVLAVAGWLLYLSADSAESVDPAAARQQFLASATDVSTGAWNDWEGPEIEGVTGEVAWSESEQRGFLRLVGLPPNDAELEQYQLWIIDDRGLVDATGQSARISGAIFNAETGETIVPIDPAIPVKNAAAFAVTIEKPGGVWASDMTRRVVIAAIDG